MKRIIYPISCLLCSMLVLVACSVEDNPTQEGELCITSMVAGLYNRNDVKTRAVNESGFDGVVKREFVAGDEVTIYKDGDELCKVTCNGNDSWTDIDPPLRLVKGKKATVKISFNEDEIYALAVYDRTQWKTDEDGCWGSISTSANSLTAVLKYSKALVTIESIVSLIGNVKRIKCIGGEQVDFVKTVDKAWAWEQMFAAEQSFTGFIAILDDNTEISIPLGSSIVLEANKQYTFRITMQYGEYRAWIVDESKMGTPPNWGNGGNYGESQTIIYDEEDLRAIADDLDGSYLLANDIILDSSEEWTPLGTSPLNAFSGEFDGNGYVINGMKIGDKDNPTVYDYAGLFGYVKGATLLNVHVANAEIYTIGIAAGAIAGCAENTVFDLCSTSPVGEPIVTNTIQVTGSSNEAGVYAGGIIGLLYEEDDSSFSEITRCWSMKTIVRAIGTANQTNAYSGGLVGRNNYGGIISSYSYLVDSYATGPTTVSNISGGLVGSAINDSRNTILSYGCCSREKFSDSTGSVLNISGDLIGEAKGMSGYEALVASCWAWKNGKHESSDNLIPEFIVVKENVIMDKCLEHDCNMTDFGILKTAAGIDFNNKVWNSLYIWDKTDGYALPEVILSYAGNSN